MDLNYIKKATWYRQQTEGNPYFIYQPCRGAVRFFKSKKHIVWFCNKEEARAYLEQGFIGEMAEKYLAEEKKHFGNMNKMYQDWVSKITLKNEKIFQKIDNKDIKNFSDKELLKLNKDLVTQSYIMWTLFFMDIYDIDAEGLIERELVDNKVNLSGEEKAIMMTQNELIVQQEEEKNLLKIVRLVKKTPGASNTLLYINAPSNVHRLKLHPEIEKEILQHQQNFFWVRNSWGHSSVISVFEIVEMIKQILGSHRDASYELKKLENYEKDLAVKKKQIIKKYKMSKWLGQMFEFFSLLAIWRDERKIQMQKLNHYFEKIGGEVGRRSNMTWEEIKICDPMMLKSIPVNKKLVEKYKKFFSKQYLLIWDGKKEIHLSGKESKLVESALESTFNTKVTEIRGMIACPGKIKGEVVIINKKNEFGKMQNGKVLVTTMTRPEFVPLLKQASAIITDEGGITSHAAIVSRELKIPCIIGTKVATKVLKDGDKVEVNANHGVVRIIEQ